jgi:hypothetical protein
VRGGRFGLDTALQAVRSRVRFPMGILKMFINIIIVTALGSTQPLRDTSTRILTGGKDDRCVMLTTLLPACADYLEINSLNLLDSFTLYVELYLTECLLDTYKS